MRLTDGNGLGHLALADNSPEKLFAGGSESDEAGPQRV